MSQYSLTRPVDRIQKFRGIESKVLDVPQWRGRAAGGSSGKPKRPFIQNAANDGKEPELSNAVWCITGRFGDRIASTRAFDLDSGPLAGCF